MHSEKHEITFFFHSILFFIIFNYRQMHIYIQATKALPLDKVSKLNTPLHSGISIWSLNIFKVLNSSIDVTSSIFIFTFLNSDHKISRFLLLFYTIYALMFKYTFEILYYPFNIQCEIIHKHIISGEQILLLCCQCGSQSYTTWQHLLFCPDST